MVEACKQRIEGVSGAGLSAGVTVAPGQPSLRVLQVAQVWQVGAAFGEAVAPHASVSEVAADGFDGLHDDIGSLGVRLVEVTQDTEAYAVPVVPPGVCANLQNAPGLKHPYGFQVFGDCEVHRVGERPQVGPHPFESPHVGGCFRQVPAVGRGVAAGACRVVNLDARLLARRNRIAVTDEGFRSSGRPPFGAWDENEVNHQYRGGRLGLRGFFLGMLLEPHAASRCSRARSLASWSCTSRMVAARMAVSCGPPPHLSPLVVRYFMLSSTC